jgi:serine/threonine-protein kinase
MVDDRWRRIERLYHVALGLPAADRARWLAFACGGDDELRSEIEDLVRYDSADPGFLERSALTTEARALARGREHTTAGRRLGGYELVALVGAGGTGEVYRARDVRLHREVALKVFEDVALLGPLGRFDAEARAASALNHPNIVTIYGVGEEGDTAFIAMELVHGRSLRELLDGAPLPASQAIDIAVQLAEAIAVAHTHGLVHRDLKPENVMVTPQGRVKVLDFGIATLQHDRLTGAEAAAGSGTPAGTVGYMSPEQARGGEAGPASDQFSFGIICHEMLVGRRPFAQDARQDTVRAKGRDEPCPVPPDGERLGPLAAILARCLAQDPEHRYADSAELLTALRRARDDLDAVARARPTRRRAMSLGALAAVGALSGVAAWRSWPRAPALRSLVVLPFANPAGDERTALLSDGITETLIRQLAKLPALTVIARTTAFTFKGRTVDPRAVGTQLGVDAALAGAVIRRAGRVSISAELIESSSGARLWGADFDRPAGDVLAVQYDIAEAILRDGIRLALDAQQQRRLSEAFTDDPEAFEQFLQAVHHLRLATESDYLVARGLLERAVARAPRFALALVTLASTYSVMAVDGYVAPADAWPEAERLVARALAADADLADAHAEMAMPAFYYRWNWAEAEREWNLALRLRNELQSELLSAYALQKWALGQPQAALDIARAACQVDPLSAQASVREADLLAALGREDEATRVYERVVRELPDDPRARLGLAEVRRKQGRFDEAIALVRSVDLGGDEAPRRSRASTGGAASYEALLRESARWELDRLAARHEAGGYVSALDVARAHARLGDVPKAFEGLRAAFDERAPGLVLLRVDPAWNALRGDARFAAVVAQVGLP